MRTRDVKPSFFDSERVANCEPFARLLFIGLWCLADREGKLEYRPLKIKAKIFPYDALDVDKLLSQLYREQFVVKYDVNGKTYLKIVNFCDNQRIHPNEAKSRLPEPQGDVTASRVIPRNAVTFCSEPSCTSEPSLFPPQPPKGGGGETALPSSPPPPAEPALMVFPTSKGKRNRDTEWSLTQQHVDELTECFPGLNILLECRRALAWVNAHLSQRKTADGMMAFLFRWMKREANRFTPQPSQNGDESMGDKVARLLEEQERQRDQR